jgi:hypothetical protein
MSVLEPLEQDDVPIARCPPRGGETHHTAADDDQLGVLVGHAVIIT